MPLLRLLLPLLAGFVVAYWWPSPVHSVACALASVAFLAAAVALHRSRWLSSAALYLFSVLVGAALMGAAKAELQSRPPTKEVAYDAVVLDQPQREGKTFRFDIYVLGVKGYGVKPFRAKMSVYQPAGDCPWRLGTIIHASSYFSRPEAAVDERFNYARFLFTQGFKAQTFAFADHISACTDIAPSSLPLGCRIFLFSNKTRNRLRASLSHLGITGDNLAVMAALALGDKSLLNGKLRDTYSVAGASHVLALSGLHLGIIFALLTLVFERISQLRRWVMFSRLLVIITVWTYVFLVGMPTSAVRSAVMLTVLSVVRITGRGVLTLNALALAALVVLLANPLSLFDVGFQMSFLAVLSIVLFAGPLLQLFRGRFAERHILVQWAAGLAAASLSAQIGVAPLVVYYFGRFPTYFLFTNFIAVPLATLLLYAAVLLLACSFSPLLQEWVGQLVEWCAGLLNGSLSFVSSLPGASIDGLSLTLGQVLLCYAMLLALRLFFARILSRGVVHVFTAPYPGKR